MSMPISEFMTPMPHTIGHDMPISKAMTMMREHSCHHLPVLDGGQLVGIISDRDLNLLGKIENTQSLKMEDLMTEEPVVVPPTEDVFQVVMLMHQKRIGSVIISASDDQPWGIFTSTDALGYLSNK